MDVVVTVAVHLVNALTPGQAHGRSFRPPGGADLVTAATTALRAGGTTVRELTAAEAAEFCEVAASLREVFCANAGGQADLAARRVNDLLLETGARPALDRHDGEGWHLHFRGREDSIVTGWAAGCATGLAVVVGSSLHGRLGV